MGEGLRTLGQCWRPMVAILVLGLLLRAAVIFRIPHHEGDELIYQALVEQVLTGKGYTLRGHPLLERNIVSREDYDQPLFFHPPVGILYFAGFVALLGPAGMDVAQLVAYLAIFASMVVLAAALWPVSRLQLLLTGFLAAFQPILLHVQLKHWIDNPRMALLLSGAALMVALGRGARTTWADRLGWTLLALSCLTKLENLVAVPFVLLLAIGGAEYGLWKAVRALVWVALPVAVWLGWSFWVTGQLLTGSPGRPSAELLATSFFVRHVTTELPWTFYLYAFPSVCTSTVAAGVVLVRDSFKHRDARGLRPRAVLALWFFTILFLHTGLAALGYSKLLRYLLLLTPAAVLLTVEAAGVLQREWLRPSDPRGRGNGWERRVLLAVALLGCGRELAFASQVSLVSPKSALINPVLFPPEGGRPKPQP